MRFRTLAAALAVLCLCSPAIAHRAPPHGRRALSAQAHRHRSCAPAYAGYSLEQDQELAREVDALGDGSPMISTALADYARVAKAHPDCRIKR